MSFLADDSLYRLRSLSPGESGGSWNIERAAEFLGNQASDRSERLMPWSIARFVLFKVVFSSCDDEHIKAIPLSSLA